MVGFLYLRFLHCSRWIGGGKTDDVAELFALDGFVFDEVGGDAIHAVAMLTDELFGGFETLFD